MGKKTLVRDQDKFMLRLPEGMRGKVNAAAFEAGRSMNAEIIARLAASFGTGDVYEIDRSADRLSAVVSQLETLLQIASPAGERIRSAQDEAMEPVPATGQPPVGTGSHLSFIDTEDRSGEAA